MNTMIRKTSILMAMALMSVFTACESEDEVNKPVISDLEIGIGDSHVGYIGSDLHIEAEVVAEAYINQIVVEIHAEDGSDQEIEATYDYSEQNLKNTTFHEHVDIPSTFTSGEYHFHLIVTDKEGNSISEEADIELEELEDEEAPTMAITAAPSSGQTYVLGDTIAISGTVEDNESLAGLLVALVYAEDSIADADVSGSHSQLIVMLHTHTFDSEASHSFNAEIEVGAADDNNMTPETIEGDNAWKSGDYYILIKSKDANGNWAYSDHYPLTISL